MLEPSTRDSSASPPSPWTDDILLEEGLLAGGPAGLAGVARLVGAVTAAAATGLRRRRGPLPGASPAALAQRVATDLGAVLPDRGGGAAALLSLARRYAEGTVDLSHPAAAAHLQPPALTVAAAADLLANVFNASVDTWDSGPYAVELERHVVSALTDLAGYGGKAGGVLTSGGTASNLHGLLLARDVTARTRLARDVPATGVSGLGRRAVVLCSRVAHFSVAQACGVLGLGEDAVMPVAVDDRWRMRADALEAAIGGLGEDALPLAVVATAGTTDFGSVDPLPEIAEVARRHGVRLHVDAAYGGGALFSDRLRPLLAGLYAADTITLDLHKTAWQPAAASALLVRHAADLDEHGRRVAYLNPCDDGAEGYDGLLNRSLATTRRADALKVAATFLVLGRRGLGALLDTCHDLASYAGRRVRAHPRLELTSGALPTTVVFRYLPRRHLALAPDRVDALNAGLRRRLMRSGAVLIGRTTVDDAQGRPTVQLKLTLLNPRAQTHDVDALLDAVVRAGDEEDR